MQLHYGPTSPRQARGMTLSEMASSTSARRDNDRQQQYQQSVPVILTGNGAALETGSSAGGAASRILDNLLGDMLAILEDSEDDDDDAEASSDAASSISSSSSSDDEGTLQVPPTATSPAPSEREEGEVESEEELRLKQQRKLLAEAEAESREARRRAREEKRKKSIEENVSQRDVFRYLKKNGFPNKLLNDFTQACISKSGSNEPTSTASTSQQAEDAGEIIAGPSKEDIHKLSSKHSFKHILHKAEKAKESKDAIGKLLDTCTTIVAEEEAAQEKRRQKQSESDRRSAAQEKSSAKGNYTGRKHVVDRSTATDPEMNARTTAQAGPSYNSITATLTNEISATKAGDPSSARNNRLPTPTSPTRNTAVLAGSTTHIGRDSHPSSKVPGDTERAAKSANMVARFQHVLNSKQLNFTKKDLEKFNIRPTASTSNTANQVPSTHRAPMPPALNGISIASSSSFSEASRQSTSRDVGKDGRNSRQDGVDGSFKPVGSTSDSTARTHGTASTSRIIQGSSGTQARPSSITMRKTTVNSTSTDPNPSSSANAKSIYDLIPEDILRKKSPHAYNSSLPTDEDTSMQVDQIPTASTSNQYKRDTISKQTSLSPTTKVSLALPQTGIPSREREKRNDNSDVDRWFGSSGPREGAYSPLDTYDDSRGQSSAPPASRRLSSLPPSSTVPSAGMRPFRTSMSPPPSNRGRQGLGPPPPPAGSPPPPPHSPPRPSSATSSLPPPPSHLPARPTFVAAHHAARGASPVDQRQARQVSPVDTLPARPVFASEYNGNVGNAAYPHRPSTNPEKLKAMFPTSFHKPTALPKKAHTYNEVTSSNEAVPIVQRQTKGLDPRMIAAERMKLLREKERDSENSDKEKGSTSIPSTLPTQATVSATDMQNEQGLPVLTQGQKDAMDSSASPDSLFQGSEDADMDISPSYDHGAQQAEMAPSAPLSSRAQQVANANLPLPNFRRAGQAIEETIPSTERSNTAVNDEKKQRELDLKHRLKRARDENSNTPHKDTSNKRQAREVASTTEITGTISRTTIDGSPPLPTSVPKTAHGTSADTARANSPPSTSRRLINSAGRRVSEIHRQHAIEDDEEEEEAVAVAPSRADKPAPPKKSGVVPVVEVQVPSSSQGSIAATISARKSSVDSRTGASSKPKSAVARKSTGGFKQKPTLPVTASTSTTAANPRQGSAQSTSAPAKEGIKVTLKLGGGRTATAVTHKEAPAQSSSSKGTPTNTNKQKPSAKQASRTVIEIDDSSDDTDDTDKDGDRPLRKAPVIVKKAATTSSSATPVVSPPSSVNKARPRARPLAGSGTRLSDIGLSQSPPKAMRSSSADEEAPPPAKSQAKMDTEMPIAISPTRTPNEVPMGNAKSTTHSGKETSPPSLKLPALPTTSGQMTPPVEAVPTLANAKNLEDHPAASMSSPPMPQRNSLSPPFDEDDADEVIPDSESEAYSPSQMPRYSLSPVPDEDNFELSRIPSPGQRNTPFQPNGPVEDENQPLAKKTPVAFQPEASLNPPPMPMTQVASSQSPEDSQMLRSASEVSGQCGDEVDMLASDGDDNALVENLLKDTLDDLPDLPIEEVTMTTTHEVSTTFTSNAEGSAVQKEETVTVSKTDRHSDRLPTDSSTQKAFMDPMDLSQAFGDDDDGEEEDELQSPAQSQQSGQVETRSVQPSTSRNLQHIQESRQMEASTARSPTTAASSLEKTNEQVVEGGQGFEQTSTNTPSTHNNRERTSSEHRQPKRATASDFMASQIVPPTGESMEAHERTPLLKVASIPAQIQRDVNTSPTFTSPLAPPSEAESFEIIMGEQSPMQSFTGKSGPPATPEISQHTKSMLDALDKPLEEPFTRCRWATGCLDMNCSFAHPSPALQTRWATNAVVLPKLKKECPDAVFCANPACILSHPSPAARRKEICANQANCPYGVKCIFRHVDEGSSQLTRRYQSHNQSTRFVNPPVAPNAATSTARQHLSPPPPPGTTTTHQGTQVSSSTLPFLSYHPMPPIPPGSTPPLSRSASPAVGPSTSNTAGPSSVQLPAQQPQPAQQSSQFRAQEPQTMQQPQQTRPQGPHRSWTNLGGAAGAASSAAGWLANKAGLSK